MPVAPIAPTISMPAQQPTDMRSLKLLAGVAGVL